MPVVIGYMVKDAGLVFHGSNDLLNMFQENSFEGILLYHHLLLFCDSRRIEDSSVFFKELEEVIG